MTVDEQRRELIDKIKLNVFTFDEPLATFTLTLEDFELIFDALKESDARASAMQNQR